MAHRPPDDVKGSARPPKVVVVAHPLTIPQLSTSELPGKHKLSTVLDVFGVAVVWNNVDVPETKSAGSVASCSRDGGEFEVDSDSQGLGLTSLDNRSETSVPGSGLGLFAFGSAWSKLHRGDVPPRYPHGISVTMLSTTYRELTHNTRQCHCDSSIGGKQFVCVIVLRLEFRFRSALIV